MTLALLATHLLCAFVFFIALGVEIPLLVAMRRAESVVDLTRAVGGFGINTRIGPPALLGIVATGVALAGTTWGWAPPAWIGISFAALVANAVIGGAMTGRVVVGLRRALEGRDGPLDGTTAERARASALVVSFAARLALIATIAVVMVLHPTALEAVAWVAGVPLLVVGITIAVSRRATRPS